MSEVQRQRLVTWEAPARVEELAGRSGLEYLQAMLAGELPPPPIARLLDFRPTVVERGRVVFACTPTEMHYNPIGSVHGGLAATLLDSAMSCAIQTLLPAGVVYTTLELHVNYVRPLTESTGEITCEGEVLHAGRTVATAQGRVRDAAGRLYSHGTTTCMVLKSE